jgi:hypothetical protein
MSPQEHYQSGVKDGIKRIEVLRREAQARASTSPDDRDAASRFSAYGVAIEALRGMLEPAYNPPGDVILRGSQKL